MRLLIVGGKLQGTEAAYLAAKAGWETVLVDRRAVVPAAGIADRHVVVDVTTGDAATDALIRSCDVVLPACEDIDTLEWLAEHVPGCGVPLAFDMESYRTTESKLASNRMFAELDIPRPVSGVAAGFPVVVKPSSASGSAGVSVVTDEAELAAAVEDLRSAGHEVVTEQFVAGPSLSIEVIGWAGRAVPLQVTGLEFDAGYDCKRVVAPVLVGAAGPDWATDAAADAGTTAVSRELLDAFDDVAVRLSQGLGLNGLMDVEAMVDGGVPRVLEIDARLPSQTPTAVYWSTGLNLVQLLVELVRRGEVPLVDRTSRRACVYQHVVADGGALEVLGEHAMSGAGPLRLLPGFFGADEALTDYRPHAPHWAATIITTGDTVADALTRGREAVAEIAAAERLEVAPDNGPLISEVSP